MKHFHLIIALILFACAQPSSAQIWTDCPTGQGSLSNSTLVIQPDSVDMALFDGSVLAVYNQDGVCVGSDLFQYTGGGTAVTVTIWGADEMAPDPRGATVGDTLSLRVLNDIEPSLATDKPFVYQNDELYIITSAGYPNDQTDLINALNDQIAQLEADVAAITAERDAHLAQINNLNSQVTSLQNERDALQSDLTDEQAITSSLNDQIARAIAVLTEGS